MFPPHGAPGVAVVLCGNCPRWQLSGWQLSGGSCLVAVVWVALVQVEVVRILLLHQQQTHADKLGMINQ